MAAIITDTFRKNSADFFVNDVTSRNLDSPDNYNSYYIGLGKSDVWAANDTLADTPANSLIERQDILSNLIVIKEIQQNNIFRVLPKGSQEWISGRAYKRYDPTDPTCFQETGSDYACYAMAAINGTNYLYLCLDNNFEGNSTTSPTSVSTIGAAQRLSGDGYVWTLIGEIPIGDFELSTVNSFFEIPVDQENATDTAGDIFGFNIINGGSNYTANTRIAATVRGETLDGENATARTVYFQTNGSGTVTAVTDSSGNPITYSVTSGWGGFRKASVDFTTAPAQGSGAKVIPLVAPANGFAYDNLNVFPAYYVGVSADFVGDESNDALTALKFRQVSIIRDIGSRVNNDDPEANSINILDSLNYLVLQTTPAIDVLDGFYLKDNNGNLAWVDQIIGTKVYYHQNSELGSTLGVISDSGSVEIFNSSDLSQGTFTISSKGNPEHINNTGEVLFVENKIPIARSTAQTEKVRIILQF